MSLHRYELCRPGTRVAAMAAIAALTGAGALEAGAAAGPGAVAATTGVSAPASAVAATTGVGAPASAVAATNPAPQLNVVILWDPATPASERKLWTIYLYARAAATAVETEHDSLPLGEHASSFDEEVRARLLAVNLYRELRRSEPALSSAYFADLDRVEAAGYLREYVWRYLKSAAWTRPPHGLALASFDAWRSAHLRHHLPVTHGRIALRLAAK